MYILVDGGFNCIRPPPSAFFGVDTVLRRYRNYREIGHYNFQKHLD